MGMASDGGAVEAEEEGGDILYEEKGLFVLDGAQEGQGMQASQRCVRREGRERRVLLEFTRSSA